MTSSSSFTRWLRASFVFRSSVLICALGVFVEARATVAPPPLTLVSIDWGVGARPITGDSDVSTMGTLVQATNFGDNTVSSATVGGVLFGATAVPNDGITTTIAFGGFTLKETESGLTLSNRNYGVVPGGSALNSLTSEYRELLVGAATATVPRSLQLTMPLTVGHNYLFQWWSQYEQTSATGGVTLAGENETFPLILGQYALGTFTAVNATMGIEFSGSAAPYVNAFQLRDITAVPEPATYAAFFGLAGLAVAFGRRQRLRRG